MQPTRRAVLAGASAACVGGAAGCLGGDGSDDASAYECDVDPADPDPEYRPAIGDPDADVVVRAFEDFTCGHCATYKLEEFPAIREAHVDTGAVRYEHWDFPIPVDEDWAVPVASAARGVGARAGDEAFFAFTSAVYEYHGSYTLDAIGTAAEAADVDPCTAIADAEALSYEAPIASDRDAGVGMDVQGTPTVFVNGTPVEPTAEAVADAIDAART